MTNTDMTAWQADSSGGSQQVDLYSTGHTEPQVDSYNLYETSSVIDGSTGYTNFTSYRVLDPGSEYPNDYVIQIGTS